MFTPEDLNLFERIERSDFYGARAFASSVKRQGFMTPKQREALRNMSNSIRPWCSRSYRRGKQDGWDHDDLSEGWDGV